MVLGFLKISDYLSNGAINFGINRNIFNNLRKSEMEGSLNYQGFNTY